MVEGSTVDHFGYPLHRCRSGGGDGIVGSGGLGSGASTMLLLRWAPPFSLSLSLSLPLLREVLKYYVDAVWLSRNGRNF